MIMENNGWADLAETLHFYDKLDDEYESDFEILKCFRENDE